MLYEKLKEYGESDWYPFHMPGHKRNGKAPGDLPYGIDITEITGFDDLHHPEGILRDCMEWAAKQYGVDATYFLVNGSTCGIQAAISAAARPGENVIVARNCHKSVYHTLYLRQLKPAYVYPEELPGLGINGAVRAEQMEAVLEQNPGAKAVIVVSPTYDGIVSDIRRIASVCHDRNVPLIVDEAHGAHFPYHDYFPESAIRQGADAVIQSLHKTLPALTQTALLHCQGELISRHGVEKFLRIYQSSSPSYVLMSSIDGCLRYLAKEGSEIFAEYVKRLEWFYGQAAGLRHLYVPALDGQDRSKILISLRRYNEAGAQLCGSWLKERLREYRLEPEMAGYDYVVALTSCMDTEEGFQRLAAALQEIDKKLDSRTPDGGGAPDGTSISGEQYQAERTAGQLHWIAGHTNQMIEEAIYVYPPGIPIAAAGEVLTVRRAAVLKRYAESGLEIRGIPDSGI